MELKVKVAEAKQSLQEKQQLEMELKKIREEESKLLQRSFLKKVIAQTGHPFFGLELDDCAARALKSDIAKNLAAGMIPKDVVPIFVDRFLNSEIRTELAIEWVMDTF